ncbi:creatininase family protein [Clostridium cellulovorans]|uniref:Creatininase n=1 Tax=Clostridium cellulovorans (strain ATCC 35296 / DSM 3052 / OCM 3 / 743B) TaxID=573061 RepID=D9SKS5_CLOC7|nr:creatininase family protein [Clostridium cellulovorans]ADL53497.1 Creatininase [Clostridium cellulovorans 743B]
MDNSIFQGTMVDMTYVEVENLIKQEAVVLLPVAVIEEHGPHLPLGTDTYLTYAMFKHIQDELDKVNVKSVIAPPFYWGINVATSGFPGSFTVKVDTMKAVLKDTIECLYNWGFKNVYILNMHGDSLHSKTIVETVKEIYEVSQKDKKVYNIIPEFFQKIMGLDDSEPYLLIQKEDHDEPPVNDENPYMDIHAGGFETSLMLLEFKELVNEEMAKGFESSKTTFELLRKWQQGGVEGREITPLGYCGNPSNINLKEAKEFTDAFVKLTVELIVDSLKA